MSSTKSKSDRINFSPAVKQLVQYSSGGYCAIARCLIPLFGRGEGKNGPKGVFLGQIAHIYSAASKGPGGQGGMTEEFIASESNAMAICASCHTKIDKIRQKFTQEDLLAMKAVRERAHSIALRPVVEHYVARLGPDKLDPLVWQFPDETDDQIAERFIRFGYTVIPYVELAAHLSAGQCPTIAGFAPLPIVQMIQNANAGIVPELDQQSESDQVDRTRELMDLWLEGEDDTVFGDMNIECDFYTRDRFSLATSKPLRLTYRIEFIRRNTESGTHTAFEIKKLLQKKVGLDWRLYVEAGGVHGHILKSSLKLDPLACPDHTDDEQGFRHYEGYARIVREIESGRVPEARLSVHSGRAGSREGNDSKRTDAVMYPLEFKIQLADSVLEVQQALAATQKVYLAKQISEELDVPIVFRHQPEGLTRALTKAPEGPNEFVRGFFTTELTEPIIRQAIHESTLRLESLEDHKQSLTLKPVALVEHEGIPNHVRPYRTRSSIRFRLESVSVFGARPPAPSTR